METTMEITETKNLDEAKNASQKDMSSPTYYDEPMHLFPASAGSGKTYRLSFEYLCLLLKNGEQKLDNFRHVLAITFTNKATAEMKERILKNLEQLANGTASGDYVSFIAERLKISTDEVKSRAGKVFRYLLHDFSHFSVETIDAFFQRVIRNMAHELHIGTGWNVELDKDRVKNLAVRRLLNKTKNDADLRDWVEQFINQQLEDGKDWNVRSNLETFSDHIFDEHLLINPKLEDFFHLSAAERHAEIKKLIDYSKKVLKDSTDILSSEVAKVVALLDANGVEATKNVKTFFKPTKGGLPTEYKKTIINLSVAPVDDVETSVFTKDTLKKFKSLDLHSIAVQVQQSAIKMMKAIDDKNTASIVNAQLFQVGLFADLYECVKEIQQEENLFMLSFAQPLLHKMIGEDDAPFIYEKIGSVLHQVMIDEFQDTSEVQFGNFIPLIENCCSANQGSLVVGDAKQGIYRFRGGDWRLIDRLLRQADGTLGSEKQVLTPGLQRHNMDFNYRSSQNVVSFNNALFSNNRVCGNVELKRSMVSVASQQLNDKLETSPEETRDELSRVYADSHQLCTSNMEGYVKVLLEKQDKKRSDGNQSADDDQVDAESEQFIHKNVVAEVQNLKANGVDEKDILILVRKNKLIPSIASCLRENGIKVASTEAFMLGSSLRVRLIIDAMRYIDAHFSYVKSERRKDNLFKLVLLRDWNGLNGRNPFDDCPDLDGFLNQLYDTSDDPENQSDDKNQDDKKQEDNNQDDKKTDFISNLPLMEMAHRIHYLFMPDKPFDEYEYCFFDHLRDYVGKRMVGLGDFLKYWDEKLISVKIPGGAQKAAGVEVLSIHKSKGLERHSVILADCSWKLTGEKTATVWCELEKDGISKLGDDAPQTKIPLLPISITDKISKSSFKEDYRDEMVQAYVENVNLLYVALTRAVNNLIVIGEIGNAGSISKLLAETLDEANGALSTKEVNSKKETVITSLSYEVGSIVSSDDANGKEDKKKDEDSKDGEDSETGKEKTTEQPFITEPDSFENRGCFNQSASSRRFVQSGLIDDSSAIQKGLFYHSLFEGVDTIKDPDKYDELKRAVENLHLDGSINEEQKANCLVEIDAIMKNLDAQYIKSWFGEHLTVWKECPILTQTDDVVEQKRPDRLVYDKDADTFTVIDYKTGASNDEQQKQVKNYMELVHKMRPNSKIKGYLWYIFGESSNVIEVKLNENG